MGPSASYVTEILVTGLQATVWVFFSYLLFAKAVGINTPTIEQLTPWAVLITVFLIAFAYTLGTIIDRTTDTLFKRWDDRLIHKWFYSESAPSGITLAKVHFGMLLREKELNNHLNYMRSRRRLTRSASFNFTLITLTGSVLLWIQARLWIQASPDFIAITVIAITAVIIGGLGLSIGSLLAWRRISKSYYTYLVYEREWAPGCPFTQAAENTDMPDD